MVQRDEVSLFDPPDVYLSVTGDKKNPGIMVYDWDFNTDKVTTTLFSDFSVKTLAKQVFP